MTFQLREAVLLNPKVFNLINSEQIDVKSFVNEFNASNLFLSRISAPPIGMISTSASQYVVKYKDFYSSSNTSKGYANFTPNIYKYQWIWAWNSKTEEFVIQLGNMNYYFEDLSNDTPSQEAREAMACALYAVIKNRKRNNSVLY